MVRHNDFVQIYNADNNKDKFLIILGLWDVLNPKLVCEILLTSHKNGRHATEEVVAAAIAEMPACGVRDNITVIAIFLNEEAASPSQLN